MRETGERMLAQLREWFAAMPRNRKIQLGVLSVCVIALAIVLVSWMSRTVWVPITSDPAIASNVYSALNELSIPTRVEGTSTILVPQDRLGDARMRLQDQNILTVPGFDRSILDDATGFGITESHARQLYDLDLAERIRTTLMTNPKVLNALVIVFSAETSPFRIHANARPATAMISLTLINNETLSTTETLAIADLVKASVPTLEDDNISITDHNFNRYQIGDSLLPAIDVVHNMRMAIQNRLIDQYKMRIEQLLIPIFGPENIRVQPHVILNWDVVQSERIEYEPPVPGELDGIMRSMETIYEQSRRLNNAEGIPGTDENAMGMGAPEYPWGDFNENDIWRSAAERANYEINQLITQIDHADGIIQEASATVFLNSEIELDDDITAELIDGVAKSIGVSPNNISLSMLPFLHEDTTMEEMYERASAEIAAQRNRELIETVIMYAVILLLGIMAMLLIRTLIRAVKPPPEPEPVLITAGPDSIDYIVDDDDDTEGPGVEYEDVELNTKSPGLEQIERFIDKDSASVAQLLRNWLSDE